MASRHAKLFIGMNFVCIVFSLERLNYIVALLHYDNGAIELFLDWMASRHAKLFIGMNFVCIVFSSVERLNYIVAFLRYDNGTIELFRLDW